MPEKYKVLFFSRGNKKGQPKTVVFNQGESLKRSGVDLEYFAVAGEGKGVYLKSILRLRRHLRNKKYDLIHAHYSLSGFSAALSFTVPVVVSLMGSDIQIKNFYRKLIRFFNRFFWKACIVKSEYMKEKLGLKKAIVIPNGVDTDKFSPIDKEAAFQVSGYNRNKINILFAANPARPEKNFALAQEAFQLLADENTVLHVMNDIPNECLVNYYNSADIVLLTSKWEGSPNVIKEAMACNCKIVSTDVGDVKWLLEGVNGCFVTDQDAYEICDGLKMAMKFDMKPNSRQRIIDLALDSKSIAEKIKSVYSSVI